MKPAASIVFGLLAFVLLGSCGQPGGLAKPGEGGAPAGAEGGGMEADQPERKVIRIQTPAAGEGEGVTVARYETRLLDPVLEELRELDKKWKKRQSEATGLVRDRQEEEEELERVEKLVLRSSLPEDQRPGSVEEFEAVWHQPPQAQYRAGTCWAFGTTSFLESEVKRIAGLEIKLSEIATVYWEYLAKASRFVEERGDSAFEQGSECNSVTRMWKNHGAWPLEAYPGVTSEDPRHDHQRLFRELEAVLESVEAHELWDEPTVLGMLQAVQDRELGRPPETFEYGGKTVTSQSFMTQVLEIDPDDYIQFISTLELPFYRLGEFKVPDNWWRDDTYHNVPIEEFYGAIKGAIKAGYGVAIAVDVSEPGKDAENDVMFIPAYDIPGESIDQIAREYRFAHKVTTDDHAVHLVGHTEHAGHDWFLIKDSGRSSRHGKHEGYYFMRDDYVRLKVLSFMVHREAVADLLSKFPEE